MDQNLKDEAAAFDKRVKERIKNGVIPDLRNCQPNSWFYNNPWRHPEYVQMVFGEYLSFALKHIPPESKVLEVGSGLGHMTLELARFGHKVTGVELSEFSVNVAEKTARKFMDQSTSGTLSYYNTDFLSWSNENKFDVICFFLTLHHFEQPEVVINKVNDLLSDHGKIIVVEPARDLFSKRNAVIAGLIRILLQFYDGWHEKIKIPSNADELDNLFEDILFEYREAREKNENEQSPNDNSAYASEMLSSILAKFEQIELSFGNTLIPRLVGGIRGKNQEETLEVARFIKLFDTFCTTQGFLDPGAFYFAGTKKSKE